MKCRNFVIIAVFVICSWGTAAMSAEQQPTTPVETQNEPATRFERFLLTKGVVLVREFYDLGRVGEWGSGPTFQVARAYTPGKTDYLLALKVVVPASIRGDRAGVLDVDEVTSLNAALPKMAEILQTLKTTPGQQYTEVEFKGGSLRIGFFVDAKPNKSAKARWFIEAGVIGRETAFLDETDFPKLQSVVQQAVQKIQELSAK